MKKKPTSAADSPSPPLTQRVRLQRILASAGLGSRRECESLITEGRVEVDGQPCTELGTKVDPDSQEIRVDGERIRSQKLQYFMLNKPPGVLSTNEDPDGRTRVIDLIRTDLRVYNVGRLDQSSEGLIVVTNDGDLAYRLTHPKFGVEKRYLVQCVGCPTLDQLQQLERGVYLAEGKAKVEKVSLKKKQRTGAILEMVLTEGRNREIRRVLAAIGHKVTRLKRIAIGPLHLGELAVGAHRRLTHEEIQALKQVAKGGGKRPTSKTKSTGPARTLGQLKAKQEEVAQRRMAKTGKGRANRQRNAGGTTDSRSNGPRSSNYPKRQSSGQSLNRSAPRRGPKRGLTPPSSGAQRDRSSAPRGSAPRGSAPRGSAPRGSAPRGSAPRGSAPRGSASRGSASRGSASRGSASRGSSARGSAPRKGNSPRSSRSTPRRGR